jgi:hypothetical protein
LAAKYNEKPEDERDVVIAKVDCTIETALCSGRLILLTGRNKVYSICTLLVIV